MNNSRIKNREECSYGERYIQVCKPYNMENFELLHVLAGVILKLWRKQQLERDNIMDRYGYGKGNLQYLSTIAVVAEQSTFRKIRKVQVFFLV